MRAACVDFLQRLIQTPSLPGQEGAIAALVHAEMERLRYDRVWTDRAGNVIGLIRGRGTAPAVMFNTHLDHVDVGDPDQWPYPPYGGTIQDGQVWGRGACDIKGPLAAQVYGIARLKQDPDPPPGDVYVSGVVQEEIGGVGARYMATEIQPQLVVVGEPSRNEVRRGHRGRTELVLHVRGRSAHASAPERGVNPLDVVARFILGLSGLDMRVDPDMGPSTVAPTVIRTDQTSTNVIPAEVWLTCDWRNVPGESSGTVQARLQALAEASLIDGAEADVVLPVFERVSYSGFVLQMPADMPAYSLPADHVAVSSAVDVLRRVLPEPPPVGFWTFATDGGNFAEAGLTVIGFGPGDESLAHTIRESIPISQLEVALAGNAALARFWPTAVSAAD